MAETGCLKDGHFNNLQVENTTIMTGNTLSKVPTSFTSAVTGDYGIHEHFEVVEIDSTPDDDDVAKSLLVKLPVQAIIIEAALVALTLATSADASVALEVHSAAVADDGTSAGTEIIGADVSGNLSSPNANLNIGSGDTAGAVVHMGNLLPVARSTDETYLHVCAKENMSGMTGTPKVGVYVKWIGKPAVTI